MAVMCNAVILNSWFLPFLPFLPFSSLGNAAVAPAQQRVLQSIQQVMLDMHTAVLAQLQPNPAQPLCHFDTHALQAAVHGVLQVGGIALQCGEPRHLFTIAAHELRRVYRDRLGATPQHAAWFETTMEAVFKTRDAATYWVADEADGTEAGQIAWGGAHVAHAMRGRSRSRARSSVLRSSSPSTPRESAVATPTPSTATPPLGGASVPPRAPMCGRLGVLLQEMSSFPRVTYLRAFSTAQAHVMSQASPSRTSASAASPSPAPRRTASRVFFGAGSSSAPGAHASASATAAAAAAVSASEQTLHSVAQTPVLLRWECPKEPHTMDYTESIGSGEGEGGHDDDDDDEAATSVSSLSSVFIPAAGQYATMRAAPYVFVEDPHDIEDMVAFHVAEHNGKAVQEANPGAGTRGGRPGSGTTAAASGQRGSRQSSKSGSRPNVLQSQSNRAMGGGGTADGGAGNLGSGGYGRHVVFPTVVTPYVVTHVVRLLRILLLRVPATAPTRREEIDVGGDESPHMLMVPLHYTVGLDASSHAAALGYPLPKHEPDAAVDEAGDNAKLLDVSPALLTGAGRCMSTNAQPCHALLLSDSGGVGKSSVARIAGVLAGFSVVTPTFTSDSAHKELRATLRAILRALHSGPPVMLLLQGSTLVDEAMLLDVQELLTTGRVSGLFSRRVRKSLGSDRRAFVERLYPHLAQHDLTDEAIFNAYIQHAYTRLRVVITCADPTSTTFQALAASPQLRGLRSRLSIDWFHDWRPALLQALASALLHCSFFGIDGPLGRHVVLDASHDAAALRRSSHAALRTRPDARQSPRGSPAAKNGPLGRQHALVLADTDTEITKMSAQDLAAQLARLHTIVQRAAGAGKLGNVPEPRPSTLADCVDTFMVMCGVAVHRSNDSLARIDSSLMQLDEWSTAVRRLSGQLAKCDSKLGIAETAVVAIEATEKPFADAQAEAKRALDAAQTRQKELTEEAHGLQAAATADPGRTWKADLALAVQSMVGLQSRVKEEVRTT